MRIFILNQALVLAGLARATQPDDGIFKSCLTTPLQRRDTAVCEAPKLPRKRISWRTANSTLGGISWQEPEPEDCVGENCIFLDPLFDGGIVLISTPHNAERMEQIKPLELHTGVEPPFTIGEVPGKGQGLVANRSIKRGETIMAVLPKLVIQLGRPFSSYSPAVRIPMYDKAVFKLPDEAWVSFIKQTGEDINERIVKNCFRMYIDQGEGGDHLGCFPDASKFNHDCRPNVIYRIQNMTHVTVAIRDIAVGEELTVTYMDATAHFSARQERLLDNWGFKCTCAECSASSEKIAASDQRLDRIRKLEAELKDFSNDSSVTADTGAEMVQLYRQERLDIYLGPAYTRAAINFALFGETEKAQEYAALAAEAVALENGPDALDVLPMRVLAEDPKKHWSWAKRRSDLHSF